MDNTDPAGRNSMHLDTSPSDKIDGVDLVFKCKSLESQSLAHRRKFDWQWLVRTLYVRGYHFASYNRGTNTILFSTRTGVQIPINLVGAHLRAVRNQVTSFDPKWECLPAVTTQEAFQNVRYSAKVLDYIYEKAQIKRKIKEIVTDSLMYSIGIWQFDVDKKGNIVIFRVDPFDFLCDPNVKSPNINDPEYGAEYVVITNQVSIDSVKKNKNYENNQDLSPDNKVASAEYKQFLLQVTKNAFASQKEFNQTIIVKQCFMRERDDNGDIKIRAVTYTDGSLKPLRNELLDTDEYPFEVMQGDIIPGDLYGESWIKHLIPINRVIDSLESHIFEYNHFFAQGKWIVDKNSGVRLIVNQHGQIIEKNRNSTVTPVTVPPLPPSPMEQIANMRKYLEDISGAHDVSLGRLPGTIRSGVAIAELRQADSTNQADVVDNLEDFLARAGRKILKLVSEHWSTSRLISTTGVGGKPDYFVAIGESGSVKKGKSTFKNGDQELPLAVIGAENEVRVQVGSWLAYTKEAREEKLKELYRLGIIDQQTYLQYAEFADIDGILERSRQERIFQQNSGSASQAVQKEFGIQMDDESIALAENELMDQGVEQFAHPDDNHQVHIMIHREDLPNKMIEAHIKEHEKLMRWKQTMMSRPIVNAMGQGMAGNSIPMSPPPPGSPPIPGMPASPGGPPTGPPGTPNGMGAPQSPPGSPAPIQPFMRGAQIGPGATPFNRLQPTVIGGPVGPGGQPV